MYPVILQIGRLKLYSYGLMMALAFLTAGFLLRRELKKAGYSPDMGDFIVIGTLLGGVLGAKLYYIIANLSNPGTLSLRTVFSGTGLVWYGGLMGGTAAAVFVIRFYKASVMAVLDLIAPALILGYAFGRMGCFLSGDGDYGPPTTLPWGMAFPNGTVPTLERVHPTPLYEIALSLMIFAFLWKMRGRTMPTGWKFSMYLILAAIERFIVEFWRLTSVVALGLTTAQFTSIIMVIVGIAMMLYFWKTQTVTEKT